jgi:hypothetical protein
MKALFESILCCSCGRCSSSATLCETCELSTLRANGLPEILQPEINGLSKNYSGNRGFECSELYNKIKELRKFAG